MIDVEQSFCWYECQWSFRMQRVEEPEDRVLKIVNVEDRAALGSPISNASFISDDGASPRRHSALLISLGSSYCDGISTNMTSPGLTSLTIDRSIRSSIGRAGQSKLTEFITTSRAPVFRKADLPGYSK
jgi:hypothetical protein